MRKLLKYETRRLLLNKFYLGLLLITGVYSWQLLSGDIIRGIGYTAPFSGWSYGYYAASVAPLLSITLLFFLTYLYSPAEKRTAQITAATPMDPRLQLAIRFGAMCIGYALQVLLAVGVSLMFYWRFFGFSGFSAFLVPAILVLVPCFLLTLGLGAVAGRAHSALLYGLMLVLLVASQVSLPGALDFAGGAYFQATPLTLPVGPDGEPAFAISGGFALARAAVAGVGALLIAWGFARAGKRPALRKA